MMPDKNLLGYANRLNGRTLHWARLAYIDAYSVTTSEVTKEDLFFASCQRLVVPLRCYRNNYSNYRDISGLKEHFQAIKDLISFMES